MLGCGVLRFIVSIITRIIPLYFARANQTILSLYLHGLNTAGFFLEASVSGSSMDPFTIQGKRMLSVTCIL